MRIDPGHLKIATSLPKILTLEPSKAINKIYGALLSDIGRVTCTSEPEEFFSHLATKEYSVALCEIQGPSYSPSDLSAQITEASKETKIIIVSHLQDSDEINLALRSYASHFVGKPFLNSQLVAHCMSCLKETFLFDLDPVKLQVHRFGRGQQQLTASEYRFLSIFASQKLTVVPQKTIASNLWDHENSAGNLHTLVSRMKGKLGSLGLAVVGADNCLEIISHD